MNCANTEYFNANESFFSSRETYEQKVASIVKFYSATNKDSAKRQLRQFLCLKC